MSMPLAIKIEFLKNVLSGNVNGFLDSKSNHENF